jgi:ABC-2 type transport system permease protein
VRNRTTLFNALALAPATVGFLAWIGAGSFPGASGGGQATARFLLTTLTAIALIFVVYYNLTTTLVARREELVLKRLLTGEVSRAEAVVACAVPAVAIVLAQLVLGAVAVALWISVPPVANPLWILLAVVGGTVVFVLLAVVSSGVTRTVESAQLTTLPVIMVAMALSGFTVPLDLLPDVVRTVASWTPMYPVVALLDAGLGGRPADDLTLSGLGQPLLCLVLWTVNGVWAARRWMRWEPRR